MRFWIGLIVGLIVGFVLTVQGELPLWGWEHGVIELVCVVICCFCLEVGVEMID